MARRGSVLCSHQLVTAFGRLTNLRIIVSLFALLLRFSSLHFPSPGFQCSRIYHLLRLNMSSGFTRIQSKRFVLAFVPPVFFYANAVLDRRSLACRFCCVGDGQSAPLVRLTLSSLTCVPSSCGSSAVAKSPLYM